MLRTLAQHGTRVLALEDPGEVEPESVWSRWGMEAVSVAVDDLGIDTEALARTAARAVVLTPAHQSPTGVVLAPMRRQALAAWADKRGATIIEDDYDAEFRYDRDPVGALQAVRDDWHGRSDPRSAECFGAGSGCTFVAGGPLTGADSVASARTGARYTSPDRVPPIRARSPTSSWAPREVSATTGV